MLTSPRRLPTLISTSWRKRFHRATLHASRFNQLLHGTTAQGH